jgi:putative oxidoreductase
MQFLQNSDLGKLILRIACGGIMLFHGVHKVRYGIQGVIDMTVSAGLPAFIAYGNYIGEFIAPILVLIGFQTRIAAVIIAVNMLLSILIGHSDIMFKVNDYGGWMIETNMLYLLSALALAFTGAGRYSVSKGKSPWD